MHELLMAFGLVLVIEGLLYALVPGHLRRMTDAIRLLSDDQLRMGGVAAIALGVLTVWLVKSFGG